MEQILLGLERGLKVEVYSKPEFESFKMEQIRLGLEGNLNVSIYANLNLNLKK